MTFVKDVLGDYLYFFGYSNHPTEKHDTEVFNFDKHSDHNVELFKKFEKMNVLQQKINLDNATEKKVPKIQLNKEGTFPLFWDDMLARI